MAVRSQNPGQNQVQKQKGRMNPSTTSPDDDEAQLEDQTRMAGQQPQRQDQQGQQQGQQERQARRGGRQEPDEPLSDIQQDDETAANDDEGDEDLIRPS